MKSSKAAGVLHAIGRRLAELRQARGWTQAELAEKIDVTGRYLQSVEGGHENLTVDSLVVLATALKVPLPALFEPPTDREQRRGRPPKR